MLRMTLCAWTWGSARMGSASLSARGRRTCGRVHAMVGDTDWTETGLGLKFVFHLCPLESASFTVGWPVGGLSLWFLEKFKLLGFVSCSLFKKGMWKGMSSCLLVVWVEDIKMRQGLTLQLKERTLSYLSSSTTDGQEGLLGDSNHPLDPASGRGVVTSSKGLKKDFKDIKVPWEYRIPNIIPLLTCLPYSYASDFSCSFAGSRMKTSQGQQKELLWAPLFEMGWHSQGDRCLKDSEPKKQLNFSFWMCLEPLHWPADLCSVEVSAWRTLSHCTPY